jgi:apolipoprotein D and lipocalin family protein
MLLASLLLLATTQAADPPLAVVQDLDLPRLAGEWYEIATIPTFFTRGCTAGVSRYTPVDATTFEVLTTCRKGSPDGEATTSDGTLRVAEAGEPAKLEIQYVPLIWGDYWIIERGEDYSYIVVGHPSRDYLWIYSREPAMESGLYRAVSARLATVGYDLDEIVETAR